MGFQYLDNDKLIETIATEEKFKQSIHFQL